MFSELNITFFLCLTRNPSANCTCSVCWIIIVLLANCKYCKRYDHVQSCETTLFIEFIELLSKLCECVCVCWREFFFSLALEWIMYYWQIAKWCNCFDCFHSDRDNGHIYNYMYQWVLIFLINRKISELAINFCFFLLVHVFCCCCFHSKFIWMATYMWFLITNSYAVYYREYKERKKHFILVGQMLSRLMVCLFSLFIICVV